MYSYKIKFLALNDTIEFEIKSENKQLLEVLLDDLFSIFATISENNEHLLSPLQENSSSINQKINEFVLKYNDEIPQFNGVSAFFRKLSENEKFVFLPNVDMELEDTIKLYDYLKALKENTSFEELSKQTDELFGDLMRRYHIGIVGMKRKSIGERDRLKRICRFCNNQRENVTFNNKAHAISEALGNKTVILLDECDACNKAFSEVVEPDIIQYLSLFRTIFNVKGKAGKKKFDGSNFRLEHEENVKLSMFNMDGLSTESKFPDSIKLSTGQPIALQNIYKSLCKYFLSVIDKKYLPYFQKTIEWINGKIEIDKLPKIGELVSYHSFSLQPKINYYIRKDEISETPFAVGEFYFTCYIFVFIIPLCDKDDTDFLNEIDFENYWKAFKHLNQTKGWVFRDYSNNVKKDFNINLNFEIKKK